MSNQNKTTTKKTFSTTALENTRSNSETHSGANNVRTASAPNFCPPETEGATFEFQDEKGDVVSLEFLGSVLLDGREYATFIEVTDDSPALSDGEVIILEAIDTDDDGQPSEFELVAEEAVALQIYDEFKRATKDLYTFA